MAQATAVQVPAPREGVDSSKELYRLLRELQAFSARFRQQSFTWDPPIVAAFATVDTTFTAAADGNAFRLLKAGMPIVVSPPSAGAMPAGLGVFAFCPASDSLTVRLMNSTALAIDPPSGAWALWGFAPP